jgi:phosphate transport system permease protein
MASAPPVPRLRDSVSGRRALRRVGEALIEFSLLTCGLFSVVVTLTIAGVLIYGSIEFFAKDEGVWMAGSQIWERFLYFFTGDTWSAAFADAQYGILPLLTGTLIVAAIAAFIALPIGLMTAIYLSEYSAPRVRAIAKPTLELLAGIPTVVYGFFAITVITPFLAQFIDGLGNPFNMLSGGIVVGIMIIPMVASLSEDAVRAVPRSLRDGAIALGANKFETSTKVVVPAALSGITASFILALSRAIGETMAVTLACGYTARFTFDPREGAATMTSFIVRIAQGDVQHGGTDFNSLFAVAAMLFFMTLGMNVVAQRVLKRYRQVYQ